MKPSSSSVWFRTSLTLIAAATICLAGCAGKGGKTQQLKGKVTYGGDPLGGGTVVLQATGDRMDRFESKIDPDGSYSLVGVTTGEYNVGVETESVKAMATSGPYNMGGMKPPAGVKVDPPKIDPSIMPKYVQIPLKYRDPKTSGLPPITIQQGNKEPKNIDLPKG